jgi:hypothetical protein
MMKQIRAIAKPTFSRCPACLDSIDIYEPTLSCSRGHAEIHRACQQLIRTCPAIGCNEPLDLHSSKSKDFRQQISITERDLGSNVANRERRLDYFAIQNSKQRLKSLNNWNVCVGLVLGFLTFIVLPFAFFLISALVVNSNMRQRERATLNGLITKFGGPVELLRYELNKAWLPGHGS